MAGAFRAKMLNLQLGSLSPDRTIPCRLKLRSVFDRMYGIDSSIHKRSMLYQILSFFQYVFEFGGDGFEGKWFLKKPLGAGTQDLLNT
jgi:hypothetical protein